MADEEMTLGEIGRTLARIEQQQHDGQRAVDDRLTKLAADMVPTTLYAAERRALQDDVEDVREEVRAGFERVEKTSLERRDALAGQIRDVKKQVDGRESGRTAKAANWIAFSLLLLTAIGLLVTIAGHGGK